MRSATAEKPGWVRRDPQRSRRSPAPRLRRIEGRLLAEHYWLGAGDECWFLREYVPGAGYRAGGTNDLISNLKKPPGASAAELGHKERGIEQVAGEMAAALAGPRWRGCTLVAMPPSVLPWEEGHDDRMERVCWRVGEALGLEVRELLVANETVQGASRGGRRRSPAELGDWIDVNEDAAPPWPEKVLVVDDVVAAGAHFVAARRALEARFPGGQETPAASVVDGRHTPGAGWESNGDFGKCLSRGVRWAVVASGVSTARVTMRPSMVLRPVEAGAAEPIAGGAERWDVLGAGPAEGDGADAAAAAAGSLRARPAAAGFAVDCVGDLGHDHILRAMGAVGAVDSVMRAGSKPSCSRSETA